MESKKKPKQLMPYGYIRKRGRIAVDPAKAKIVKHIFESYSEGKSPDKIANELNQLNTRRKNGKLMKSSK